MKLSFCIISLVSMLRKGLLTSFAIGLYQRFFRPKVKCCLKILLLRLPVGYGGVLNSPGFCFFFGVESWAAAHGLYRCTVYRLLSEPMSTRLLNSISSRICRQNTQFNMYTTTSKQQEGCTFKDSHPKCFITTNFDKFHREAVAKAVNRGDVLTACFRDIQSQRSTRMEFVIIMILFDVKDYRLDGNCSISFSPRLEKI